MITHVEKPNVRMVVDRIRRQLEAERFMFGEATLGVTASFGISGFEGGESPKFNELLRQADSALDTAKRAGRNRIEFESNGP